MGLHLQLTGLHLQPSLNAENQLLTNQFVNSQDGTVNSKKDSRSGPDAVLPPGVGTDVMVIEDPAIASSVLDPVRGQILHALGEPGSATTVAAAIGLPRQKVNYHLRSLEANGLVHFVEERQRRGLKERVMVAAAQSYLLSPAVLGQNAVDPERTDHLSTRYLVAIAARMVREVADLARRADRQNKPLATLSIDTEIKFGSAQDRAAFTNELAAAVRSIAGRYHDEQAPDGRWHRLIVAAHPRPPKDSSPGESTKQIPNEGETES